MQPPPTFEEAILRLQQFWKAEGCLLWQPFNAEVGAGTMNPATFLRVLGPEPWSVAYVEPSVRPDDSRYGDNPNRMQTHTQFQVVLKPDTGRPVEQYLRSLGALGIDVAANDVRLVEDNWESPALGAWGLGWEIWLNGLEITQFTYFQQSGGFTLDPVAVEITYGLERILMALQRRAHFKEIEYAPGVTYGRLLEREEYEMSAYYLDAADVPATHKLFDAHEGEAEALLDRRLVLPAYRHVLAMSHLFNVLDARGAVGVAERAGFFARMRRLSRACAELWVSPESAREGGGAVDARHPSSDAQPATPTQTPANSPATAPQPLLLEVGTEELPSADVETAVGALEAAVPEMLAAARLEHGLVTVHATPRRLVVLVDGVAPRQEDRREWVRGPKADAAFDDDGAPTKAGAGFARRYGLTPDQLRRREFDGHAYVVAEVEERGRDAVEVLSDTLRRLLESIAFTRGMRWNASGVAFSRPVRWLVALLGDRVVPFEFAGVVSGQLTRPLRGSGQEDVRVDSAGAYESVIERMGVMLDRAARRDAIWNSVRELSAAAGGEAAQEYRGSLLHEVADLVESPTPLRGSFEERFLSLPPEVLRTVMVKHQRFFPIMSGRDVLPAFVAVANGTVEPDLVREGNEAVIRARYSDAQFFYEQDRRRPFASFRDDLRMLTFHERLGSMWEKAERLERLTAWAAEELQLDGTDDAVRAAHLAKNDLVTAMVIEFSGLAGTMGMYYAQHSGESPAVAEAIRDHVRPVDAGDAPPRNLLGAVLGVVDRLDSLVGLFAAGVVPRSSADPYALRRTAYGLVQILVSHDVELDLERAVGQVAQQQPLDVPPDTCRKVLDFIWRRLEVSLRDEGLPPDVVSAAVGGTRPSVVAKRRAATDLVKLAGTRDLQAALGAHTRAARITKDVAPDRAVNESLFATSYEADLWRTLQAVEADRSSRGSLPECVRALTQLTEPINALFDNVFIMSDEPGVAENRLRMLRRVADLPAPIADLRLLRGPSADGEATEEPAQASRELG